VSEAVVESGPDTSECEQTPWDVVDPGGEGADQYGIESNDESLQNSGAERESFPKEPPRGTGGTVVRVGGGS